MFWKRKSKGLQLATLHLPDGWGHGVPYKGKTGGAVWLLDRPASDYEISRLRGIAEQAGVNPDRVIDMRSVCGKRLPNGDENPDYSTYRDEMTERDASRWSWLNFRSWGRRR